MAEEQAGSLFYEISADVKPFLNAMKSVQKQLDAINQKLDENGQHVEKTEKKINGLSTGFSQLAMAVKLYAVAQSLMKIQKLSEEFTLLQARVTRMSGSLSEGQANFRELMNIANETGASMKDTVGLWSQLTASLKGLGATTPEVNSLVSTLQKIGVIGGSSAEEMGNALRQFQQSIASGKIQAEEFNSILEQMPELARQIAKGMGIPYDELRSKMLAGQLDIGEVLRAIRNQTGEVNEEFEKMPRLVSSAASAFMSELGHAISVVDEKIGASKYLAKLLDGATLGLKILMGDASDLEIMQGNLAKINDQLETAQADLKDSPGSKIFQASVKRLEQERDLLEKGIQAQKDAASLKLPGKSEEAGYEKAAKSVTANKNADAIIASSLSETERLRAKRDKLIASKDDFDPKTIGKYNAALAALDKQIAESEAKGKHKSGGGGKSSDSIEQSIANMKEQAALQAENTKELTKQEFVTKQVQSLGKNATDLQKQRMKDAATDLWNNREGLKIEQAKLQNQKALAQLHAQAQMVVNPTTGVAADPLAGIKQEAAEKKAFWDTQREQEKITAEEHQQALTDIEKVAAGERIDAAQKEQDAKDQALSDLLGNTSAAFGTMTDIIGQAAGKNSAAYAAMFAVSKGFALAQAGLDLQVAISKALAQDWPANMALVAQAVAAGGQVISTIGSMVYSGGRKNGGPVLGGSAYRVGEGNLPEIFKAGNGNQYMIPGQNGRVISNSDLGGAGGITQNVTFNIQTTGGIDDATMQRMTAMMKQVSLNTIRDQQRPNGLLQRSR